MSESARMWVEISFNIVYLIAVWGIVIAMTLHKDRVAPENRRVADLGRYAFALLALGDTGHVGFRVWAYASDGLESTVTLLGREVGLVVDDDQENRADRRRNVAQRGSQSQKV